MLTIRLPSSLTGPILTDCQEESRPVFSPVASRLSAPEADGQQPSSDLSLLQLDCVNGQQNRGRRRQTKVGDPGRVLLGAAKPSGRPSSGAALPRHRLVAACPALFVLTYHTSSFLLQNSILWDPTRDLASDKPLTCVDSLLEQPDDRPPERQRRLLARPAGRISHIHSAGRTVSGPGAVPR